MSRVCEFVRFWTCGKGRGMWELLGVEMKRPMWGTSRTTTPVRNPERRTGTPALYWVEMKTISFKSSEFWKWGRTKIHKNNLIRRNCSKKMDFRKISPHTFHFGTSENTFIPWAGCDDNTNKYSIYFLVYLELNEWLYGKSDIFICQHKGEWPMFIRIRGREDHKVIFF